MHVDHHGHALVVEILHIFPHFTFFFSYIGTTLALASCPDLVKVNVSGTKIISPIPIKEQHAFVQELAGDTLTEDIMNDEAKEVLKDAFLKFIAVRSPARSYTYYHYVGTFAFLSPFNLKVP